MIELIHDPFDLWDGDRSVLVNSHHTRKQAYKIVDEKLRGQSGQAPSRLVVLVTTPYWRQFRGAYKGIQRVCFNEITPSRELASRLGRPPPAWLNDELIHALQLHVSARSMCAHESWAKWVLGSIFPENEGLSYEDWVRSAYSCEYFKEELPEEVMASDTPIRMVQHEGRQVLVDLSPIQEQLETNADSAADLQKLLGAAGVTFMSKRN